jgi:hypothetical protein
MKFKLNYFLLAALIFSIEVLIASVFKEVVFVRAYLGDVLVVIFLYALAMSFYTFKTSRLLIAIFIFASLIEVLQYYHFAEWLGFGSNRLMMIVLGNSFCWGDLVCYAMGCLGVWVGEKIMDKMKN